ncbi:hypothetical protein NM688_g6208 [Phlebia brevispora]|uniref:Uncharacterized protein n=1 Tax=Phlebia brevispora TaxID=194682 RepID=A0ACC1SIY0_9APHY|nr:hypothetical protein NM688_g6208 [Phlebia brevispora]
MQFSARNLYYLRISAGTVLPLYLYLDEQHIDWMSERVLQHVLADLRPLIPNKLTAEADAQLGPGGPANAKRGTVEVHRGDTYQFGYFLRHTDPHAVVIKTRTFTVRSKLPKEPHAVLTGGELEEPTSEDRTRSRTRRNKNTVLRKQKAAEKVPTKRKNPSKGKRRRKAQSEDSESEAMETEDEEVINYENEDIDPSSGTAHAPRRSTRKRTAVVGRYRELDDSEDEPSTHEPGSGGDKYATIGATSDHEISMAEDDRDRSANEDPMQVDPKANEFEERSAVKTESTEPMVPSNGSSTPNETPTGDMGGEASTSQEELGGPSNPLLVEDEEEEKPKPIMSLKYRGFSIHGRSHAVPRAYRPCRPSRT